MGWNWERLRDWEIEKNWEKINWILNNSEANIFVVLLPNHRSVRKCFFKNTHTFICWWSTTIETLLQNCLAIIEVNYELILNTRFFVSIRIVRSENVSRVENIIVLRLHIYHNTLGGSLWHWYQDLTMCFFNPNNNN